MTDPLATLLRESIPPDEYDEAPPQPLPWGRIWLWLAATAALILLLQAGG